MAKIRIDKKDYTILDFVSENEFEKAVIKNRSNLFGSDTVYIDVKKRMGDNDSYHKGVPDGYLIDFFDTKKPQLYFVENELSSHDVYGHITEQVARFHTSITTSGPQIKHKLLDYIKGNGELHSEIKNIIKKTVFENVDELLNYLTEKSEIKIVIVIDEITSDLNMGLKIFKNSPDVVLLQKYVSEKNDIVYYYEPMRDELSDIEKKSQVSRQGGDKNFDTVVCAAFEDGFKHAYVENNAWWAIRLSQKAREQLKYLAIYEKSPIGEIKHVAEIEKIEPYKDTGKYILHFKSKKIIKPIKLDKNTNGVAPQSPRYTSYEKLLSARVISELWK